MLRKYLLSVIMIVGVIVAPGQGLDAQIKPLATAAGWSAFGGTATGGQALCGVKTESNDAWFSLKYFARQPDMIVQLSDRAWRVRVGDRTRIVMQFDNNQPWRAIATDFLMNNGRGATEFRVAARDIGLWLRQFRAGRMLRLQFPGTNIPPWSIGLTGSDHIATSMQGCISKL